VSGALRFFTLDAFARDRFAGVPIAVIEDADALSAAEMQLFAREFNLPATAFLGAPRDQLNSARLRVFSPSTERAYSAEAIVGVAALLAQTRAPEILARGDLAVALEMGDEVWRCDVIRNRAGICYAEFALKHPQQAGNAAPAVEALAGILGLAPADFGFRTHAPLAFDAPQPFLFAPVRTREALQRARPAPGFHEVLGGAGVFLYTEETLAPDAAVEARLFGPDGETAAGAEAMAAFAEAACECERPRDGDHQIVVDLGQAMGRLSRLTLCLSIADGIIREARLGGQAVIVATGEVEA
jgi:trans-2,3-dihydro-3-hydroxyanthranilate isomerase